MWGVALIYIAVASSCCRSCNAELYQTKTAHLPMTDDNRIVGGSPTTIEKYPFAVQLIYYEHFRCGGSLVTTRHVLSAAHCVIRERKNVVPPETTSIRAGTTYNNAGGSLHKVKAIKAYDLYDVKVNQNDVAVILMATPVDLTTSVARLAFLPSQDIVVPDNSFVTSIGWGWTEVVNSDPSSVLKEVTLHKINMNTCQARHAIRRNRTGRKHYTITSGNICAGILDVKPGEGSCRGDSGGPLLYKGIIVGISSWVGGCASIEFPAVYVRVTSYINWISNAVNDSQLQIQGPNKTCNTNSLSSKVEATTLLTSLLYLVHCKILLW